MDGVCCDSRATVGRAGTDRAAVVGARYFYQPITALRDTEAIYLKQEATLLSQLVARAPDDLPLVDVVVCSGHYTTATI